MSENKENKTKKSRCNVRNCDKNPNVSLHLLPHEKFAERRNQWIKALQLPSNIRGKFSVCSNHFLKEDFRQGLTQNWLNYWAIPSVNLPPKQKVMKCLENVETDTSETSDNEESDELILCIDSDSDEEFATKNDYETMNSNYPVSVQKHDCATQTHSKQYADKSIQTNLAYDELLKPWTFLDILHTESDLLSWTGLQRFATLDNIVDCMMKLESAQEQLSKLKASPKQLTVFILVKLKTNLTFKQLSCLFSLAPSTLSKLFEKCLPMLKAVLEPVIFWPTKEQIYNNLPKSFKPQFEDCYVVLDCTEFPLERLQSLESRIKTYSHYKGCNTGKINITSTPSGLVANVTRAYGGKASDKYIILKEKVIENVSAGSGVMVDKGYDIAKETASKGVKLYRPPILDKPQHTKSEAIYNTDVATSRIHVERVIQRIKIFNVFRGKLSRSMLQYIDEIVFIACAITNLNSPVLSDDKF